ncbi:MAG: thioredoxin family protein [Kiritimatiellia bacterium]|jgi:thioredoxin 1
MKGEIMTEGQAKKEAGDFCECGRQGGGGKWIWIILALAIVTVFLAKSPCQCRPPKGASQTAEAASANTAAAVGVNGDNVELASQTKILPRLVDLGAGKCIPCKMMAPILEGFKKTHADKFEVQFIDVWQNPDEAKKFNIRVIPTQIFFTPDGKELFRHEGFFGKEDILGKWKELGFAFNGNNQ